MHSFNLTPKQAIELQKSLRGQLRHVPLGKKVRYIAGADVSSTRFEHYVYAGIIVLSYPDLKVIESACVREPAPMPYIPGLLSFREIPALLKVWSKLKQKPDVVMVDGQGIAHPRRLGIAAHFGLLINTPTIGVAKSRLYGIYQDPSKDAGNQEKIYDPKTNEVIGTAIRSKQRALPILVSPGHLITLSESTTIVTQCLRGYRLPEPTRQAHLLVNEFRKKYSKRDH